MPSKRKVAVYAPDGTEITYETSAGWTVAGIVQNGRGGWTSPQHGHSADSVRKRTLTWAYRWPGYRTETVATANIWDATVPCVREWFGTHAVVIDSYFIPGQGHVYPGGEIGKGRMGAGRAMVRKLLAEGATQVSFRLAGTARIADFQEPELRESLKRKGR